MHRLKALACALALAPSVVLSAAPKPPAAGNDINPYLGKTAFANKGYASNLDATIQFFLKKLDFVNAAKARTVQKIPTFSWLADSASVSGVKDLVTDALLAQPFSRNKQVVQLVVYNLPDRDCSAKASAGEFSLADDGLNKYKGFIDSVVTQLSTANAKKLSFVVLLEPDSLANVVTNLNVEKCANAASAYKQGISYAIAKLQLPNVAIYLDAGHGGWLGWDSNLAPAAAIFAEVLQGAQNITAGATVRGLATNVSNYNQYISPVRENFTQFSSSWDEFHYVNSLTPFLLSAGYPAHFIIDQGRAGQAGVRTDWGQWCNVKNAGFGTRPTTSQAVLNNTFVDAIVWVKPGGESDGTSDSTSPRFDTTCVDAVAQVPAPEAGLWFNAYTVGLVKGANPPLEPTWF
ncbi:hypothetical protein GALMADRAFT_104642 [Galerina marginata CBS 339.88]|uniref:Glucanase n=1 Tax=Galerina marginata (strain CBS 339.88) TaxID=685588 RepID=A0A067SM46_GALM3|nr:hypothetical protein GALMADRAFT_104642 [Galerina marginata CBS 339.88]